MKNTAILSLYALAVVTGLICYQWVYIDAPVEEALPVPITEYSKSQEVKKQRWYRSLGSNQSWQFGLVPETGPDGDAEIYEVSETDPNKPSQDTDTLFSDSFKTAVTQAAYSNGWDDINQALKDGYSNAPPFDFLHYVNLEYTRDDEVLNPNKPEFLMFYPTSKGPVLAGAMFLTKTLYDHGPQPGEREMIWHYHISGQAFCYRNNVMVEFEEDGRCLNGVASRRSPEMLHVWFVDHPQGPYSTDMCLPAGVIEGWEGRKTWEEERARRFQKHVDILMNKRFTVEKDQDSTH